MDFFGQLGDRPYNERQRLPGDFDAQVSQGPIANHNLEHLTMCDRGVMLLRRLLRKDMTSVMEGGQPTQSPLRLPNGMIPTYCHDTVIDVPTNGAVDDEQLKMIGKEITDIVINGDYQSVEDRVKQIKQRMDNFVENIK